MCATIHTIPIHEDNDTIRVKKKDKGRMRKSKLKVGKSDRPGLLLIYFPRHIKSEEVKQCWPGEQVSIHTFQSEEGHS